MRSSTKERATTDRVRAKCFYPLSLSLCLPLRVSNNVHFKASRFDALFYDRREETYGRRRISNFPPPFRINRLVCIYIHEYILIINSVVGLRARCGFTSIYVTLALRVATLFPGLLIIIKFRFHTRAGETKERLYFEQTWRNVALLRGADTWNWLKFC